MKLINRQKIPNDLIRKLEKEPNTRTEHPSKLLRDELSKYPNKNGVKTIDEVRIKKSVLRQKIILSTFTKKY